LYRSFPLVAAQGTAPYRALVTHGFVLDAEGRKMSKSLGNVIDPSTIVLGGKDTRKWPGYGVDVLRLWVASTEYSTDITLSPVVIGTLADSGGIAACSGNERARSCGVLRSPRGVQRKWRRRTARFATPSATSWAT